MLHGILKAGDFILNRLGDWDVNSNMEPYAHMEFAVDSIFIHEWFFSARLADLHCSQMGLLHGIFLLNVYTFSVASLQNDLALIRLSRHVNWEKLPQVKFLIWNMDLIRNYGKSFNLLRFRLSACLPLVMFTLTNVG